MSISIYVLAIYIFLESAADLQWFVVSGQFLGIVGLITAILLLVETAPVVYRKYYGK